MQPQPNISGAILELSTGLEPDVNSDEENEDVHESVGLQVDALEWSGTASTSHLQCGIFLSQRFKQTLRNTILNVFFHD